MMNGVYIHIPYCLQRCSYCDFATYKFDETIPVEKYIEAIFAEIQIRSPQIPFRDIDTIYFGGGTPSLLSPQQLLSIMTHLTRQGFRIRPGAEITIEINPGTIDKKKTSEFMDMGVNRFSVGVQTLSDRLLRLIGRKHTAQDTKETLVQLKKLNVNFNVDLLFSLPEQTIEDLRRDLDGLLSYGPPHISPYYLTIARDHPLQNHRPSEDTEIKMFDLVTSTLTNYGYEQYEISNFAQPGKRCQHNWLYWQDQTYWGIGLSAHSYFNFPPWGLRFWNPKSMNAYLEQAFSKTIADLPLDQKEILKCHEALTDFCYTQLRTISGISKEAVRRKFGDWVLTVISKKLSAPLKSGWVEETANAWRLTPQGRLLSNQVFSHILFTSENLDYKFT